MSFSPKINYNSIHRQKLEHKQSDILNPPPNSLLSVPTCRRGDDQIIVTSAHCQCRQLPFIEYRKLIQLIGKHAVPVHINILYGDQTADSSEGENKK